MIKHIYLAGGCFWGVEKYLSLITGVVDTQAGYANGRTEHPSYREVCDGSGHAEVVRVTYDDSKLSLSLLLERFFEAIDPTSVNRQGGDTGVQYRTGVYYVDEADRAITEGCVALLQEGYDAPVVIEVKPLKNYWPAEEHHQRYLDKNPGGYCHINLSNLPFA